MIISTTQNNTALLTDVKCTQGYNTSAVSVTKYIVMLDKTEGSADTLLHTKAVSYLSSHTIHIFTDTSVCGSLLFT